MAEKILRASLSAGQTLTGSLRIPEILEGGYQTYMGTTEVIPLCLSEQILETKNKIVRADITVRKVPTFETSNDAGGKTFYIGEH